MSTPAGTPTLDREWWRSRGIEECMDRMELLAMEVNRLGRALAAEQSKLRTLLEAHNNLRADYTKARGECDGLRKSELRWKRMAEFQYGKRAYPDHIELAQGALDAYFKLDFDGKDASQ